MQKSKLLQKFNEYLGKFNDDSSEESENSVINKAEARRAIEKRSFLKIIGCDNLELIPEDFSAQWLRGVALNFFKDGVFTNELDILCWIDEITIESGELKAGEEVGFEKVREFRRKIISGELVDDAGDGITDGMALVLK